VPLPSSTTILESLPRGILLLEEYSALAVAISSALRKFAPLHRVEVAHSSMEAQTLAAQMRPELFVLDVDPPPLGEVLFLDKIKSEYPDSRALVIAAGTSSELRTARGTGAAIQFIEKPFDLAEFGAAIQALVGPWNGPGGSLRGTLRDLKVLDLAQIECLVSSSAVLHFEKAGGETAEIHFLKGQIVHAATGNRSGVVALEEMAGWPVGTVRLKDLPEEGPRTIDLAWQVLFLPIARQLAERDQLRAAELAARGVASSPRVGKKILIIDDTEMLRIFVADVLTTADKDLQILTAPSGEQGVQLALSTRPDLILLDYSLADMTGDKVCAALLKNETTARIPVLMMSGHLTELARTAEAYPNVVAALPKPFLSGALINEVEKALEAASPPPPSPLAPTMANPGSAAPQPAMEEKASILPNGHQPTGDGATERNGHGVSAAEAPAASLPTTILSLPPPAQTSKPPPPAFEAQETAAPVVRRTEMNITFVFDVVALELTPALQIASARLEPVSRFVAAQLEGDLAFQVGFRLGALETGREGGIESLRLIPSDGSTPLPAVASSLSVARITFLPATGYLEIKAASERSMRVQLSASFALAAIELTPRFEVAAMLLRSRQPQPFLRNRPDDPGRPIKIERIELGPADELQALVVRPAA
jgi:DNA-binding response OmpR family regulator